MPVLGSMGYCSTGGAAAAAAAGGAPPNVGVKLLAPGLNENDLALALSFVVGFFVSSFFSSLLVLSSLFFVLGGFFLYGVAAFASPFSSCFFSSFFIGCTTLFLVRSDNIWLDKAWRHDSSLMHPPLLLLQQLHNSSFWVLAAVVAVFGSSSFASPPSLFDADTCCCRCCRTTTLGRQLDISWLQRRFEDTRIQIFFIIISFQRLSTFFCK